VDGIHSLAFSVTQQALLLALLLLTARAHASAFIALVAILLGYVMIHRRLVASLIAPEQQLQLLVTPWRAALLGLIMVHCGQGGRWLYGRKKEVLAGPFVQQFFTAPSRGWIFWPAAIICALAAA